MATPQSAVTLQWFREAFLVEFEIAEKQLLALAEAFPEDRYGWRPNASARSVSEVFVHTAGACFFLLNVAWQTAPSDIYGQISATGEERWWTVARHNDGLEKTICSKNAVLAFLKRALKAARDSIGGADDSLSARPEIRRVYMRMLAHSHEHMGQMIAYLRFNGQPVPWEDWRPDRRTSRHNS